MQNKTNDLKWNGIMLVAAMCVNAYSVGQYQTAINILNL